MKMKKALSLVLAASLALTSLAACGGGSDEEQASNSDTFKIGGIGPTTGDAAAYGTAVQNGAQLAVDEINEAGGINGKQIEFQFEDDQNNSEKSVNAYNTLKDWGMQMLVGTVTSNPCTAVVKETAEDNMFQLYSSGIYQNFAKEAEAKGLEVVAAEAFTADSKTDFSVQLQKAKSSGAELVFLPIYYQEASLILTQADKMGFTPKFFGCDGLDGLLDVEGFDTSLAEGVMLLTPFTADAEDEMTQTFVKAYEEAFDIAPIQFAADAYDCIYAIKAAAEQGEVTPDMSISDMCEAMKTAMTEITIDGLTGAGITWSADGEPSKEAKAVVISNGTYEAM